MEDITPSASTNSREERVPVGAKSRRKWSHPASSKRLCLCLYTHSGDSGVGADAASRDGGRMSMTKPLLHLFLVVLYDK